VPAYMQLNTWCARCSQGDPYKTLFVSRLSYDVTDKKLRREFEEFGPISSVKIVHDTSGALVQIPEASLART
jgi:RNA recognition motif-containing protein